VIVCESPTRSTSRWPGVLANTFETARPKEPCSRVQMETDVVLWHVPKYAFRRPDVVVYRCKEDRNAKPEASDVLLMVEVSSRRPSGKISWTRWRSTQRPGYLPMWWSGCPPMATSSTTREFHLDAATCQYRMESVMEHVWVLTYPFKITSHSKS